MASSPNADMLTEFVGEKRKSWILNDSKSVFYSV